VGGGITITQERGNLLGRLALLQENTAGNLGGGMVEGFLEKELLEKKCEVSGLQPTNWSRV